MEKRKEGENSELEKTLLYQAQWKTLHIMYLIQPSRRSSSSKYLESLQKKVLRARNCRNCTALVLQDVF